MISSKNNLIYLCAALILLLLNSAFKAELNYSGTLFILNNGLLIALSIKSLHTHTQWRRIVYVLLVFMALIQALSAYLPERGLLYFNLSLLLIYFIGSARAAAKQVLFYGHQVNLNILVGSFSIYLLLGLIWTVFYLLLLSFDAHSFSGIPEAEQWQTQFSRLAYYSFITLTTLGYGDILPQNEIAAFLSYMEAIIGVFYIAVIVASLVSISLQQKFHSNSYLS